MAPGSGVLRQLNEARQQLLVAAAEIARMKLTAESVRARQMEFLAFVAHQLRNPLAPIRTAASVPSHGRPEDVVAMRPIIERQVTQMSRMIDDLLDVSRANTGKLRLIPGGDLDGDLTRLIQVLSNLLDNASKYSPDGQTIQLVVRLLEHSVEFTVVDSGIGMSIKALKNIFDPFAQELHAVGFNPSGLGIGLAVVRDIVEAHGGRVTASSAGLGHGSRFVVTLPRRVLPAVQPT